MSIMKRIMIMNHDEDHEEDHDEDHEEYDDEDHDEEECRTMHEQPQSMLDTCPEYVGGDPDTTNHSQESGRGKWTTIMVGWVCLQEGALNSPL